MTFFLEALFFPILISLLQGLAGGFLGAFFGGIAEDAGLMAAAS